MDIEPRLEAHPRVHVELVDNINEFFRLHGSKDGVPVFDADWKVVEFCYDTFRITCPHDVAIFVETQKRIRYNLKNEHGSFKEKDAEMRHAFNIPAVLFKLINRFYPKINWGDKAFRKELVTRIPIVSVPKHL